ncbi:hypothetical protein MHK_010421 [Candidatus Magnetomorum sp. HK-1]|nr:hypothetical protein MHK_010421 [Candidatus Magnetomorum sp. HK-1]
MSFSEYDRKCHLSDLANKINSIFPISLQQLNDIKQIFKDVGIPSIGHLKSIYKDIFSDTPGLLEIPKTNDDNSRLYLFHLLGKLVSIGKIIKNETQQIPIINFVIQLNKYIIDESIKEQVLEWANKIGDQFDISKQDIKNLSHSSRLCH